LEAHDTGGGLTGYDVEGWDANVWILHAIFETDDLPDGLTHEDIRRIEGTDAPQASGRARWPELRWSRIQWQDLAARLNVDLFTSAYPSLAWFPYESWPIRIDGPEEGSLGDDEFDALLSHLAAQTSGGMAAHCFAFYAALAAGDFEDPVVYACQLGELQELCEEHDSLTPNNLWAADRSWFVYTDYDSCGTKVSGSGELIESIIRDPEVEAMNIG
jgi:hypothetical protein